MCEFNQYLKIKLKNNYFSKYWEEKANKFMMICDGNLVS